MKSLLLSILVFICLSCSSKNNYQKFKSNDNVVVLKSKFTKIDTINQMYIYHFVYGKNTGVFTHFIGNNKNLVNPKKIKLNKTYYLILQKEIEASAKTEIVEKSYYENGILIWKTGMKSEYYSSCLNVDNDKIVPKFTVIKYVDTNDKY